MAHEFIPRQFEESLKVARDVLASSEECRRTLSAAVPLPNPPATVGGNASVSNPQLPKIVDPLDFDFSFLPEAARDRIKIEENAAARDFNAEAKRTRGRELRARRLACAAHVSRTFLNELKQLGWGPSTIDTPLRESFGAALIWTELANWRGDVRPDDQSDVDATLSALLFEAAQVAPPKTLAQQIQEQFPKKGAVAPITKAARPATDLKARGQAPIPEPQLELPVPQYSAAPSSISPALPPIHVSDENAKCADSVSGVIRTSSAVTTEVSLADTALRKSAVASWADKWSMHQRRCTREDLTLTAYGTKDRSFLNQWENGKARLLKAATSDRVQSIEKVLREEIPPKWHPASKQNRNR
jgi:hypothetical protein